MIKKSIFWIFIILLSVSCQTEKKNPNILFIAIDDLRTELNCYGKAQIKSPNIDKLASEGVTFTHAYCQQAVCGPSRLSIMTGRNLESLGVFGMSGSNIIEWRETRKGVTSLPEQFRNNGYYAINIGKIYDYRLGQDMDFSWDEFTGKRIPHFVSPEGKAISKKRDEDRKAKVENPQRWPAYECYDTTDVAYTDGNNTRIALEFLEKRDKSKPFFLAMGYVKPHLPFTAPKKYWDMYNRNEITLPNQKTGPDGASRYTLSPYKEIFDYDVDTPISDELAITLRHGYYACVSYVDAQIGKIINALKESGELENTIIVLWGDHGFKLGDFGEWAKHTNLETDNRVPLIFWTPEGIGAGNTCKTPVELIDVLPTLCDAAGIAIPESAQGRSLVPLFANPEKQVRDFALSQFPRGKDVMGYSIRTENWRYTEWINRNNGEIIENELYRMDAEDLIEKVNVAGELPEIVTTHSKLLHNYLNTVEKWPGKPHG